MVYEPVGLSTFVVAHTRPCHTSGLALYVRVCSGNDDEHTRTYRSGRQAVVSAGRRSVAAFAVSYQRLLLSSRYPASAVLARVRLSVVASVASVVAAVRLAVARPVGLVAALSAFAAPSLVSQSHGFAKLNAPFQFKRTDRSTVLRLRRFRCVETIRRCTAIPQPHAARMASRSRASNLHSRVDTLSVKISLAALGETVCARAAR